MERILNNCFKQSENLSSDNFLYSYITHLWGAALLFMPGYLRASIFSRDDSSLYQWSMQARNKRVCRLQYCCVRNLSQERNLQVCKGLEVELIMVQARYSRQCPTGMMAIISNSTLASFFTKKLCFSSWVLFQKWFRFDFKRPEFY